MDEQKTSRRSFNKSLGYIVISAASIGGIITLSNCSNKDNPTKPAVITESDLEVNLADVPELQTVGGSKKFTIENEPVIVIRTSETEFKCVSLLCTHNQCVVNWNTAQNKFVCPCHGSEYAADGKVTKGPAAGNLPVYSASYDANGNKVLVNK